MSYLRMSHSGQKMNKEFRRYFFHIGYHGFHYRGWQRQPNLPTVQEVLEDCLAQILKTPITVVGCGRTDSMVSASQFFFHIDVEQEWEFDLHFRINKLLPPDIAVFDIIPVEGLPNARFDATLRTYDYFIHTYKDPFLHPFSACYPEKNLDLFRMKEAVSLLTRYNDFRAFCKSPDTYKHTRCTITSVGLFADEKGDRLRFSISANRFLGRMIRIIMTKLLEIGRGEMSVDEFEHYLISMETPKRIEPAYPQGLYLSRVLYPFLDIAPRTEFSAIQHADVDQWITI